MGVEYDSQELPELLQIYYRLLFPHKLFYKWLSYGKGEAGDLREDVPFNCQLIPFLHFLSMSPVDKSYFERREFSFTLAGDIYIRYQSFVDEQELFRAIEAKNPEKIDIGAVFNINPKDGKKGLTACRAVERELVFDIDMTDYDEVRTCCSGAGLCPSCWPFLAIAAKVLDRALRKDFGFKHLLWVYSGRRGIHCWVGDERARKLSVEARAAIGEYLTLIDGGQFKAKKVSFETNKGLHPSVDDAVKIIDGHFETLILDNQKLLDKSEHVQTIVDMCTHKGLKNALQENMLSLKTKSCRQKWDTIKGLADRFASKEGNHCHLLAEVKLQFCYPRLDINVTKGLNHLLKAPFCVHPKTGRICVPMDLAKIDAFDPSTVPSVKQLCSQIEAFDASGQKDVKHYLKTDLKTGISVFEEFVNKLEAEWKETRLKLSDEQMQY